jgi:hypothetical protein
MRTGLIGYGSWLIWSTFCVWVCAAELRSQPRSLFLRKQLALYQERKIKAATCDKPTRPMLVLLSRWFDWAGLFDCGEAPGTLIAWHRKGFRLFSRWRSEAGRPSIPAALQHLIRKMARENPSWGEERIANKLLLKLGLRVSPRTIRKYMPKLPAAPPGGPRGDRRWAVFLSNHARFIVASDFCIGSDCHVPSPLRVSGYGECLASVDSPQSHSQSTAAWTLDSYEKPFLPTTSIASSSTTMTRSFPPNWTLR